VYVLHDHGEAALEGRDETVQLPRDVACPGRLLKTVGDGPGYANQHQRRQAQLGALRQIAEQAAATGDFGAALLGLVEDADEEEGADDFDDGDEGEVANVEVCDEPLQIGVVLPRALGAAGEDGEAQCDDASHGGPEESDEDGAGAVAQNAQQDQVAVEGEACFFDLERAHMGAWSDGASDATAPRRRACVEERGKSTYEPEEIGKDASDHGGIHGMFLVQNVVAQAVGRGACNGASDGDQSDGREAGDADDQPAE